MTSVVIVGAGGFGREACQWIEDVNRESPTFTIVGFLDDDHAKHGTEIHGYPVLGDLGWLAGHRGIGAVLGVGHPAVKHRIVERCRDGVTFPTIVHPRAVIGRFVELGEGTIVCPDVILTTDIRVGRWVTLNIDITIGHDTVIGDYTTISPGAHLSGYSQLGEGVDLGTGVNLVPSARVGRWSVVGAGATVVSEIPANSTAVGLPAKPVKTRDDGWHLRRST